MVRTGIVLLSYNSYNDLLACVESIKENIKSEYTIFLVDNNSKNSEKEKIRQKFEDDKSIQLIISDENLGYSGGNNIGINRAIEEGVEYILIVNPDVEIKNDIIEIMSEELRNDVACVGPRIIDLDNKNGQRLKKNYTFKNALFAKKPFYYLRHIFKADTIIDYEEDKAISFYGSLSGCCFMMKAETFSKVDCFDSNVFLYCEEYILGRKLEMQGMCSRYVPAALVKHKEGSSTHKISNSFVDYHMYASEYYLLKNYCDIRAFELRMIKYLRLLNYFLKNLLSYRDWNRLKRLRNVFRNIEYGRCKIDF